MKEFGGKTAFVTGGASGIGLALANAFGRAGMNVMIADIEQSALDSALAALRANGVNAKGLLCDVAQRASIRDAANATLDAFGKVHICCNNAGVGVIGPIGTVTERDWDWIIDVNLKGVIHGTEVFVPIIESHGEGGHILNTASQAGIVTTPGREPYNAVKHAIVAMSEGWHGQLRSRGIGVSVLCPSAVRSRIGESARNRPDRYGSARPAASQTVPNVFGGMMEPDVMAARVVEAIRDDELHIFTHPELKWQIEERFNRILMAVDKAAASPALAEHVKNNPPKRP